MSESDKNSQSILMSPLLSNRFNKIEEKLESIETYYKDINDKFDTILKLLVENSGRWDNNKKEYINLLERNQEISEKNYNMLNDNNNVYRETLKNISQKNNENLCPLLDRLDKNGNRLFDNIDPRMYNRFWRTSGTNTIMQPPVGLGISSIVGLPWFSKNSDNKKKE